jgi:hypothetical protein
MVVAELKTKVEKYETKASRCAQQAREATDKAEQSFYEVLAGYYGSLATDFRKILEKRLVAEAAGPIARTNRVGSDPGYRGRSSGPLGGKSCSLDIGIPAAGRRVCCVRRFGLQIDDQTTDANPEPGPGMIQRDHGSECETA